GNEWRYALGSARVLVVNLVGIERLSIEERVRNRVLFAAGVVDMRAQQLGVEQIDYAQAAALHLVLISRTNATGSSADLHASRSILCGELDHAVIGKDHMRAVGDEEAASDIKSGLLESVYFFEK